MEKNKKASLEGDLNVLGFVAGTILMIARFVSENVRGDAKVEKIIQLCWQRAGVCAETKERSTVEKLYPELVSSGWKGKNKYLKYRLPPSLSYRTVKKNIDVLESYLKSEVIPKLLENDTEAHFALTILSGKLLDFIDMDIEILETLKGRKGIWVPVGYSRRGIEAVQLSNDNSCHIMIGGSTGGGKSTLLRLMLFSLHALYGPDEVNLWLCDFKHGNELQTLGRNPLLVERKVTQPELAQDFFADLYEESKRRYALFHKVGATNISEFNELADGKLPHIILVIDEFGKLEGKEFRDARTILKYIAADARAAGIHLILSTHRPTANLVDGTLKNNIPVVVCFRANPVSARVILGEDEWEASQLIDPEIPGRAIFSYTDQVLIQVPWISAADTKSIMNSHYQKIKEIIPNKEPVLFA